MRKMHPDTLAGVKAMFESEAVEVLFEAVTAMEKNSEGGWIRDPEVPMVWGFLRYSDSRVLIVAYLEECDFELSEAGSNSLPF